MASKPQGISERVLSWQVTIDQSLFASLSHTHYWYEVAMLNTYIHTYKHRYIQTFTQIADKPHAGKSIYQQYLLLCISVATSTYEGERNKKKRLGGWVRTATATGIQQADCHQISHLSAHILYLVAVRNQYAECEKQHNNHTTAVHRPRQHTRRATKIYCIQYFSARSIFNCSRGWLPGCDVSPWMGRGYFFVLGFPPREIGQFSACLGSFVRGKAILRAQK